MRTITKICIAQAGVFLVLENLRYIYVFMYTCILTIAKACIALSFVITNVKEKIFMKNKCQIIFIFLQTSNYSRKHRYMKNIKKIFAHSTFKYMDN